MDQTFMKEKNILPLVLSMSLPMVISMAVNSLYNIVDSYFVAKLSEEAMTALALVYPIQNLVTSIGVGFGIGINALISFYLGAQEKNNAHKATTIGMGLSVIHGIVLTILCLLGMPGFLRMFSSNEYTISLALQYSDVVFTFAIVSVIGISFEKVFQAVGRMKVSMFSMICGFVTNIVLDPWHRSVSYDGNKRGCNCNSTWTVRFTGCIHNNIFCKTNACKNKNVIYGT